MKKALIAIAAMSLAAITAPAQAATYAPAATPGTVTATFDIGSQIGADTAEHSRRSFRGKRFSRFGNRGHFRGSRGFGIRGKRSFKRKHHSRFGHNDYYYNSRFHDRRVKRRVKRKAIRRFRH